MKKVYVIRKYIAAESIAEALLKEKRAAVSDIFLTDYSTTQHLEAITKK